MSSNFKYFTVSQEVIGNLDIKTKGVHFYVTRNSSFSTREAVVPFELARLNEGGGMNLTSGYFNAPVGGIYRFEFSAVKFPSATGLWIDLQVNGAHVGRASTYQPVTGTYEGISLSASLRLNVNDRVNLLNRGDGVLFDDADHHTHFSGWLVEEDFI